MTYLCFLVPNYYLVQLSRALQTCTISMSVLTLRYKLTGVFEFILCYFSIPLFIGYHLDIFIETPSKVDDLFCVFFPYFVKNLWLCLVLYNPRYWQSHWSNITNGFAGGNAETWDVKTVYLQILCIEQLATCINTWPSSSLCICNFEVLFRYKSSRLRLMLGAWRLEVGNMKLDCCTHASKISGTG